MMHVLVITQYFWPESFRINDLVIGLKEKGYRITVLTGQPNYPAGAFYPGYGFFKWKKEEFDGIEVIRVPVFPRGSGRSFRLVLNYLSYACFACFIGPFRCTSRYDLIFVFEPSPITVGLPALLFKKLKKAPILFWVQDLWPESLSATGAISSKVLLRYVEKLVRFIYQGSDYILVQSKEFYVPIEKLGIDKERIRYFPNSAESLYKPMILENDAPETISIPAGFRVMFAGNIGAAQDFATILDAAEKLKSYPDIHWLILGDGRKLVWVKEQIISRGLSKTFHLLGRYPVEVMPRYFSLADVMLVVLKSDPIFSLTIPSKIQSYLACGKPIIAALDGAGAKIVREAGAGLTPSVENPEELANAVLRLYEMSGEDRRIMGLHGLEYFKMHFERNMLLDRLDGWFKDANNNETLWNH